MVNKDFVISFFIVLFLSSLASAIAPSYDSVLLNTTDIVVNDTHQNLTSFFINATGNNIKNLTDWQIEQSDLFFDSYAVINTPFEQPDNSTNVNDLSTNSNDGVPKNGANFLSTGGKDGFGAYNFDGVNDYIDFTTGFTDFFDPDTDVITTSFWFKPDDVSTTQVMSNIYANAGTGSVEWSFWIWSDGKARVNLGKAGIVNQFAIGTTTLVVGNWYHLVGVYDGSDIKLYLNGVLENSTPEVTSNYVGANNFVVGARTTASTFFNGVIDEYSSFNRVLSDDQISLLSKNVTDIIHSNETVHGETWRVCGTPVNSSDAGLQVCSNSLEVNIFPKIDQAILDSTNPLTNGSDQNLTLTLINVTDPDNDPIKNISDWRVFNGTNFTSWAVLNMPFEAGSNEAFFVDYSTYNHSGSHGFNPPFKNILGHDGFGSYSFDGVNDNIHLGDVPEFENQADFTVSFWARRDTLEGTGGVINKWTGGGDESWAFVEANRTFNVWLDTVGGGQNFTSGGVDAWNDTNWHFFAFTYNSSVLKIYKDGSLIVSDSTRHSGLIDQGDDVAFIGFWGNTFTTQTAFDGGVDDVLIFDQTLSLEQLNLLKVGGYTLLSENTNPVDIWKAEVTVSNHFDIGNTVTSNNVTITGDSPPNVTDTKPVNGSTFLVGDVVELSANVTDDFGVGSVFVDVTLPNSTVENVELFLATGSKYNNSFTETSLVGSYSMTFSANDTNNLFTFVDGGSFSVLDNENPSAIVQKNASIIYFGKDDLKVNWSFTDNIGIDQSIVNITYPNNTVLFQTFSNSGQVVLTPSNLTTTGIYFITSDVNDTSGNTNGTIDSFSVQDNENPSVVLNKNVTQVEFGSGSIFLDWSITDDFLIDTAVVNITYPNGTILFQTNSPTDNITLNQNNLTVKGTYFFNGFGNDTSGNTNSSTTSFVVSDTTPPSDVIGLNETNITNSTITWNWTNPVDSDFSHVEVLLNDVFQFNTTNESHVFTGLNAGTQYTLKVTPYDFNDNVGNTASDTATTSTLPAVGQQPLTGNIVSLAVIMALIALMFLMAWMTFQYADGSPLKFLFWLLTFIHYLVILFISYNLAVDSGLPSSVSGPLIALFSGMTGIFTLVFIFVLWRMTKEAISSESEDDLWKK